MTLEQEAMEILMKFGKDGCTIADSGGKDSSVLKRIAEKCREQYGLQYKIVHNHTGLDAPETVYFVRSEKKRHEQMGIEYNISYPGITFEELCIKNGMLPTRVARFCCKELKERRGEVNERLVTGVRRDESTSRKRNQGVVTIMKGKHPDEVDEDENFIKTEKGGFMLLNYDNDESVKTVYTCFRTNKVLVNPIINWKEEDVWKYISAERIPINPLYECGYTRVGCIGCPMGRYAHRAADFERYPKYKERYIRIAEKIVEMKKQNGLKKETAIYFNSGLDYFRWWIQDPNVKGQFSFDMDGNITEDYV